VDSAGYHVFVLLHLACVVVGYGSVAVDSLAASQRQRFVGVEAYAVAQAGYATSVKLAGRFLYGVPVFGAAAVLASQGDVSFGEPWIAASFGAYLASLVALHGVVVPAQRRALVALGRLAGLGRGDGADRAARAAQLEAEGRRAALGRVVFHLLAAAALVMMIWQPGR
jgi:hypothetical protein